jgi:hypothetical protein
MTLLASAARTASFWLSARVSDVFRSTQSIAFSASIGGQGSGARPSARILSAMDC